MIKMWNIHVILDRGMYWYSMQIKPGNVHQTGIPFACVPLCERHLHRPHLTCLWCRIRRAWYGKMPTKIPVDLIILHVHKAQKHAKLKAAIRKFLLTLAGWTLN